MTFGLALKDAKEDEMTVHRATNLESLIKSDIDLYSQYHIVREKTAEIIKWSPPVDPGIPQPPPYYTDHGMDHSKRILAILDRLTERQSIQPSRSLAHVFLGNALQGLGELERAQKEYKIALELDPGKESQAHVDARKELDNVEVKLEAREVVKLVKQGHSPDLQQCNVLSAKALNLIAYDMIMSEGQFDKIAAIVEIGLGKDPGFNYLYATKGLLHFRQGDIEQGCALYKQAISMSPDDLPLQQKFHYEYGIALRNYGKFKEAIYEFECAQKTAAEYVPDDQISAEMRKAQQGDNSK